MVVFFHEFNERGDATKQKTMRKIARCWARYRVKHPAILPWFLVLGWRPSFRVSITGTLPVLPSEPDCCWTRLFGHDPIGKLFPAFLGSTLKDMTASALCPSRIAGFDGPAKPAHESMMQKRAPTARA
jgi:hypothetical protein